MLAGISSDRWQQQARRFGTAVVRHMPMLPCCKEVDWGSSLGVVRVVLCGLHHTSTPYLTPVLCCCSPGAVVSLVQNIWTRVDKLMTHDVCGPGTFGIFQKEFGENAQVW